MRPCERIVAYWGDSGGPFNFDGEVIGIHSRIAKDDDTNFHALIESYLEHWDLFKTGTMVSRGDLQKGGFLGVGTTESKGLKIMNLVKEDLHSPKGGILKSGRS